jgi:hypothetical protein
VKQPNRQWQQAPVKEKVAMVTTKNVGARARVVEAAVSVANVSYAELCSPANDRARGR